MLQGYTEGRVIFDRYISNSLKSQTRAKLNVNIESVKFNIYDKTNIKMVPLKTFLSHIETKSQLTEYLGKALLQKYRLSEKDLIDVYGTSCYPNKENLYASEVSRQDHKEADTLICLHVLHAISKGDVICNVTIYSPHTDVFILLLHLFARNGITGELLFKTGKSKLERKISID